VLLVRASKYLIMTLLALILVECSTQASRLSGTESASLETPQDEMLVSTTSITPGSTAQQVINTLPPTISPSSTPTDAHQLEGINLTPDAENADFQICSPLSIHTLEELPEIISDPYRPPPPGKEQRHHGVDFSYYRRGDRLSIKGVGVQTVLPGVVSTALAETFPYGNLVIIETPFIDLPEKWVDALQMQPGESIYTLYAHMERAPDVVQGEQLGTCQPLGEVGVSGNAVEPHLHLEMRLGDAGASFNSLGFYKADDTEEERSNYLRWRTSGEFQHFDPMLLLAGLGAEKSPGK
jgi:murein DD-endopeptidase MepM/ murein hydrolase activator NlpD